MREKQIRQLYANAGPALGITLVAAFVLSLFQRDAVQAPVLLTWLLYVLLVSTGRWALARWYWRANSDQRHSAAWGIAFSWGAGLAGLGWGAAGIVLYQESQPLSQVFLVFVLGGMMLGGASMLASRPEAFLVFLLPTGMLPALRLILRGDSMHVAMGLFAILFTLATVFTTFNIYRTIDFSLNLEIENRTLVESLQAAKMHTDALNEQLEIRVAERTAELRQSTELLRSEIEQRHKMEQEILRARNLESLGVLAGGIAHDFNNFLTVVQGNIELVKMRLQPNPKLEEILEKTVLACQRAASLSTQLLTFAKGGSPVRRIASVSELIADVVHLERAGAAVNIDIAVPPDLWNADMDAGQISQVLHNILLNAKQALPDGGTVEVRAQNLVAGHESLMQAGVAASVVRISIQDNGPGIAPEILPRIFDPYFTTKTSGNGLGLAAAYTIVSRHKGNLWVVSAPGRGSTFSIDLPASREVLMPRSSAITQPESFGGRLLVMDDEESLRTMLKHLMTSIGYEVETAADGSEALALYEAARNSGRRFDAVLLDVTVRGGMGGIEAAMKLRQMDPSAKLIVTSGYSDSEVMSNFRECGFQEMIPKPWTFSQLRDVFRRVIQDAK